jgi:hypothetical protein
MAGVKPSASFKAFEDEANRFQIRPGAALDLRFDAKQRMIARADGFAIREAYLLGTWRLFALGALLYLTEGTKRCDERIASAEAAATHPVKLAGDDERHRAEICLNLYARTIQQFIQRRLYTVAALAAVAAAIASVAAVVLTVVSLVCGPRG